jgi:bifunctional DNA-binding transcriptional regulator/antitoxin component of YhaV-PrlF toxin-antitoxin module
MRVTSKGQVTIPVNHHAKLTRESGESRLKSCHPGIV